MLYDYLKLAVNSLLKRKLRSWLTMIGIFIGIAAVVSLIGLGEGLRNAITAQFGMLGADKITVQAGGVQYGPPGTGVVHPLELGIEDKINKIDGVDFAIPRLLKSVVIEFNDKVEYSYLGGMPDGTYRKEVENVIGMKAAQGRLLKDGDNNKVVVGASYTKKDMFDRAVQVGDILLINGKQFDVVGILKKTGSFTTDIVLLMNDAPMRELLDNTKDISIVAIQVKRGADINKVKADIEKLLRKERDVKEGEEDFTVELAVNTLKTIESTLFAVQLFIYIIAGISLLVGGIGIMNTMYTAVVERTKDIGIMKSIGAKNSDIFILFFIESGLLGIIGGFIGAVLGVALAKGLAFIGAAQLGSSLIQAHISPWLFFGALAFSFTLGCIAGITPAIGASKMHPVDALRYAK